MAVNDFKNTEQRTAFRILDKDRKIIERGISLSNFGKGKEDFIEFTLYDAGDNQLPQGDSGEYTRYISINQLNINEYFLIKDNGEEGGVEYFIDVEKIIREAGYNQGIFKIQYQLLNNRVGRYNTEKLYIHEIAPSRTEVRLVPVTNSDGTVDDDLFKRYRTLTSDGTFRDDIIYFIDEFLESINFRDVIEKFLSKFGNQYLKTIKKEFKIDNFEDFILDVTNRVKESARYYVEGKYWNPKDSENYGKPNPNSDSEEFLDLNEILKNIITVTCDIIDILLPKRNIQDENYTSMAFDPSVDIKSKIKELADDTSYEPIRGNGNSGSGTGSGNNPDDFTEEEVEVEEDEILVEDDIQSVSYLKVSPKQPQSISKVGGSQIFDIESSSPVNITWTTSDGNSGWVTHNRGSSPNWSFEAGRNNIEFYFSGVSNIRTAPILFGDDSVDRADGGSRVPIGSELAVNTAGQGTNDSLGSGGIDRNRQQYYL